MNIRKVSIFFYVLILLLSITACQPKLNSTPEDAVKNFIEAGFKQDKETFKEIIKLPQDEDAFVESYIKIYSEYAKEKKVNIQDIKIKQISEDKFKEGVLKDIQDQQGFSPVIVEVTDFDPQPLLFLLEKENDLYFIRNIDTRERYHEIFK